MPSHPGLYLCLLHQFPGSEGWDATCAMGVGALGCILSPQHPVGEVILAARQMGFGVLLWDRVLSILLVLPSFPRPPLLIHRSENRRKKKTSALEHKNFSRQSWLATPGVEHKAASSRGWPCQGHLMTCVPLPGSLKRNNECKLGRAGLTGRPQPPSLVAGSPWGSTCGFSPVRRNTQHGHPAMHSRVGSNLAPCPARRYLGSHTHLGMQVWEQYLW